ncbi:CubicO group peptidase, beta-lactamase class C family [Butyrivibrio sp. INlla18]|uniref:penicillin binding protein PBP4B n=1 Tax=Butyrivibrio sp. INlla18 TaxID=1520806 RepID=UPI00088BF96B|nr:penicillin binding protein PBP4B [Butyrivibrio sp. INlla18]SDA68560.1 CubicO group peptidase, beta-lactamase class C family [Butyrivibrio sp. INlla18]
MKRKSLALLLSLLTILNLVSCKNNAEESEILYEDIEVSPKIEASIDDSTKQSNKEEKQEKVDKISLYESKYEEAGIRKESLELIEDIINSDIENGFTSTQIAVMKDGELVFEDSFGLLNSYDQNGQRLTGGDMVTSDTMYDLASISKMIGVNYPLQKLFSEGKISLDDKVTDYLGDEFVDDTIFIAYEGGEAKDLETIKTWKKNLTIKQLLLHRGGFPASPKYFNPYVDQTKQEYNPEMENELFSSYAGDEAAKEATIKAINKTPLMYEPGTKTVYSDVDYMILGVIVEKVSGKSLDQYLKDEFAGPLGLTRVTYNPLQNGFTQEDCAATELNGNTRDGYVNFEGIRKYTIWGEVHDETAYYCMGGVSGHAGIFASATDLAKLGNLMIDGSYAGKTYFTKEAIDTFLSSEYSGDNTWGLGWWKQGSQKRAKYFGSLCSSNTFGHQGWTGTLLMVDPEERLVIALLTNKINSPVTDIEANPNKFDGNWYTTAGLGFAPEIIYTGMGTDEDITDTLLEFCDKLITEAEGKVKDSYDEDHPARLNLKSKKEVYEKASIRWNK